MKTFNPMQASINTHPRHAQSQQGFTLVELMIATTVFSVFLLIVTTLVLQVTRTYTKGIVASKTQETARVISSELSRAVQFGGSNMFIPASTPAPGVTSYMCIGSQRYTFMLGKQLKAAITNAADQTNHVLVADTVATCPSGVGSLTITDTKQQRELIGENMRLANLSISRVGTTNLYTIRVRVAYGDADLLNTPDSQNVLCRGQTGSSQFCAVSELVTTVEKRL
jgi:prepilin-type N-terminal cleavage/methylation domain-containing protein